MLDLAVVATLMRCAKRTLAPKLSRLWPTSACPCASVLPSLFASRMFLCDLSIRASGVLLGAGGRSPSVVRSRSVSVVWLPLCLCRSSGCLTPLLATHRGFGGRSLSSCMKRIAVAPGSVRSYEHLVFRPCGMDVAGGGSCSVVMPSRTARMYSHAASGASTQASGFYSHSSRNVFRPLSVPSAAHVGDGIAIAPNVPYAEVSLMCLPGSCLHELFMSDSYSGRVRSVLIHAHCCHRVHL